MIVLEKGYIIQKRGQVTLPAELRQEYELKEGDRVIFERTEVGWVIKRQERDLEALLDELGQALKAKGLTLEELMESGREIRQEIHDENYAQDKE